MEFCTSAWIYPQAHMHKHIQAFKIKVAACSGLITVSLSCSTLMRKMEQKGRRTRMKERILMPEKDSLLLLYPLLFSSTGVSVASLTYDKCEPFSSLCFGRSVQVFSFSLALALPFNGSPEAYYISYLWKMFIVFWHSHKKKPLTHQSSPVFLSWLLFITFANLLNGPKRTYSFRWQWWCIQKSRHIADFISDTESSISSQNHRLWYCPEKTLLI